MQSESHFFWKIFNLVDKSTAFVDLYRVERVAAQRVNDQRESAHNFLKKSSRLLPT
jgi:hypothetical protein